MTHLRGTWELSEQGEAFLEESISESPNPFVERLLAMPDVANDTDFDRSVATRNAKHMARTGASHIDPFQSD